MDFRQIVSPDGTRLRVAVEGHGPLVLMIHGFPESWYSWRHQMAPLAAAGFTAAAIDARGFGGSDAPPSIDAYTTLANVADAVAVVEALSADGAAVLVGHDHGALTVYTMAVAQPARVRAVVGVSVPAVFRGPRPPSEVWAQAYPDELFYQHYMATPGVAEAEWEADPERFVRRFFRGLAGDRPGDESPLVRPHGSRTPFDGLADPDPLPAWLLHRDVECYAEGLRRHGLAGPINRYRTQDRDWEELRGVGDLPIEQPALWVGGARDPARFMIPGVDRYVDPVPRLADARGVHVLAGVGHWIAQEAPERFNALLVAFLQSLPDA